MSRLCVVIVYPDYRFEMYRLRCLSGACVMVTLIMTAWCLFFNEHAWRFHPMPNHVTAETLTINLPAYLNFPSLIHHPWQFQSTLKLGVIECGHTSAVKSWEGYSPSGGAELSSELFRPSSLFIQQWYHLEQTTTLWSRSGVDPGLKAKGTRELKMPYPSGRCMRWVHLRSLSFIISHPQANIFIAERASSMFEFGAGINSSRRAQGRDLPTSQNIRFHFKLTVRDDLRMKIKQKVSALVGTYWYTLCVSSYHLNNLGY
jgi:hypothetical protein